MDAKLSLACSEAMNTLDIIYTIFERLLDEINISSTLSYSSNSPPLHQPNSFFASSTLSSSSNFKQLNQILSPNSEIFLKISNNPESKIHRYNALKHDLNCHIERFSQLQSDIQHIQKELEVDRTEPRNDINHSDLEKEVDELKGVWIFNSFVYYSVGLFLIFDYYVYCTVDNIHIDTLV